MSETAIEYGLIAAGISVVIIATVNAIGANLNGKFNQISIHVAGSVEAADKFVGANPVSRSSSALRFDSLSNLIK